MFVTLLVSISFASSNTPVVGAVYASRPPGCNELCVRVENQTDKYLVIGLEGVAPVGLMPVINGNGSYDPAYGTGIEGAVIGIALNSGPASALLPHSVGWVPVKSATGYISARAYYGPSIDTLVPVFDPVSRAVPWLIYGFPGDFTFAGAYAGPSGHGYLYDVESISADEVVFRGTPSRR